MKVFLINENNKDSASADYIYVDKMPEVGAIIGTNGLGYLPEGVYTIISVEQVGLNVECIVRKREPEEKSNYEFTPTMPLYFQCIHISYKKSDSFCKLGGSCGMGYRQLDCRKYKPNTITKCQQ